jgi:hypothetical protein
MEEKGKLPISWVRGRGGRCHPGPHLLVAMSLYAALNRRTESIVDPAGR